jgi:hypothetical protein
MQPRGEVEDGAAATFGRSRQNSLACVRWNLGYVCRARRLALGRRGRRRALPQGKRQHYNTDPMASLAGDLYHSENLCFGTSMLDVTVKVCGGLRNVPLRKDACSSQLKACARTGCSGFV